MSASKDSTWTSANRGYTATPSGWSNTDRTRARMSFDFLAPRASEDPYWGSGESAESSATDQRDSQTANAHARIAYYENARELKAEYDQTREQHAACRRDSTSGRSDSHLSSTGSSRVDQTSKRKREEDRHEYDDEERFAILYMRIVRGEKWAQLLQHFNVLFPPGGKRRIVDKGLTKTYHQRAKGGLECRYYRLRHDLNFPAVRSSVHNSAEDRAALARLREQLNLSSEFLQCLQVL